MIKFSFEEQLELYKAYNIPPYLRVSSPFRSDNSPSFSTYERNDVLYWKDFGTGDHGDIVDLIQILEGVPFGDAMGMARKLLKETVSSKPTSATKAVDKSDRKVFSNKKLEDFELEYWALRGVGDVQLRAENVESLKMLSINDKFVTTSMPGNPKFVYRYSEDSFKIYSPFDTNYKWISHNLTSPFEVGRVGNRDCVVMSSKKDRMVFDNLNFPIDTISLHSEGNFNPVIEELKDGGSLSAYDRLFCMLDFDDAGTSYMEQLHDKSGGSVKPIVAKPDVRFFLQGVGVKDIDDMYIKMGRDKTSKFIFKLLREVIC